MGYKMKIQIQIHGNFQILPGLTNTKYKIQIQIQIQIQNTNSNTNTNTCVFYNTAFFFSSSSKTRPSAITINITSHGARSLLTREHKKKYEHRVWCVRVRVHFVTG